MRGGSVFKSFTFFLALAATLDVASAYAIDPTQPPAGRVSAAAAVGESAAVLRLQAIMVTSQSAHVVINGKRLKVGDRIGEVRILAIRPHSILIDREGKREELRLSAPIIQTSRTPS